jgi:DNA-binding CsgD family transcriptional regulator
LTTIDLRFDQSLAAALASAFQLTVAEAEVALSLAKGQAPAAIATLRTASLMTVRTQIKRILRKLDAAAVPDLVRIVNGFAVSPAMSRASGLAATRPASGDRYRRAGTIILPDGRRLAFEDSGAVKGRSVLFIHDMLHAPGLTDAAIEAAQRKNEENEEEFVRHLLTCRLCWTYAERFRIGDLGDIGSYGDFPMEVCIGQRDRGDR